MLYWVIYQSNIWPPTMKAWDLKNGDIYLDEEGNIAMVYDKKALRLKILQRLRLTLGEYFLDRERGVPYRQVILVSHYNKDFITHLLISEVEKEPLVESLHSVSCEVDQQTRTLKFSAKAKSKFGEVEVDYNG